MTSFRLAAATAAALVALAAVGTAAASHLGSAAPPDPAALTLEPADVPGSKLAYHGTVKYHGSSQYISLFVPNGGHSSRIVGNLLSLEDDAAQAAGMLTALQEYANTAAGRLELGKSWAKLATASLTSPSMPKQLRLHGDSTVANVAIGTTSSPAEGVLVLPLTAKGGWGTLHLTVAYVQVDRAFDAVELVSGTAVPRSALAPLIAKARARLLSGFTVRNTSAPTISGTPAPGQVLTADTGNWSGGATDFGYVWQRCAADGSSCVAIDGAAASTYTPGAADSGSVLRVVVTAGNSVGSQQATSTQTVAVS